MIENYEDYNKLIDKAKLLLEDNKGIVLLEHLNTRKRKYIHKKVDEIENMDSFSIGYCSTRRIVFKYSKKEENINIDELIKLGNDLYQKREYKGCIETFKRVLANGVNKYFIYSKIGLSYMKLGDKKLALDYLIVANELIKLNYNDNNNFDSLIKKLKEENKSANENSDMYFYDMTNDNFGIENINDILHLIIDEKEDISKVKEKFELSNIEINIIKLFIAKEYYTDCFFDTGDRYLKEVEKSKDRNKVVNKLLNEIRENKLFYKNRGIKRVYKKVEETN